MHEEDRTTAKTVAREFYRSKVASLENRVSEALDAQRKNFSALAASLWDDKQNDESYNRACMDIAALIRDENPKTKWNSYEPPSQRPSQRETLEEAMIDVKSGDLPPVATVLI